MNYQEYCPKNITSKVISFSLDDRGPKTTKGCICKLEMEKIYKKKYGNDLPLLARVFMAAAWHTSAIRKVN